VSVPVSGLHCGKKLQNQKGAIFGIFAYMGMGMKMRRMMVRMVVMLLVQMVASSDLRPGFYSKTCPNAEVIVRDEMRRALAKEPRSVASVMRFQFHDCFVNVRT